MDALRILVTGAKGFVGKNLVETLKCIRDNKKRDVTLNVEEIYEYDKDDSLEDLDRYCKYRELWICSDTFR